MSHCWTRTPFIGKWLGNARLRAAGITAIALFAAGLTVSAQRAQPAASTVMKHLNAITGWYQQLASADDTAGRSSDIPYLQEARSLARQSVQLAFQSAEAEAAILPAQPAKSSASSSSKTSSEQQNLANTTAAAAGRISQIQSQIDAVNARIARVSAHQRKTLLSQRAELESELSLEKALKSAVQQISAFQTSGQTSQTGFLNKIADLERTVPGLTGSQPAQGTGPATLSPSQRAGGSGLIGQVSILFTQMRNAGNVDHLIDATAAVRQLANQVRAPLLNMLRSVISQGRDLANQPDTSDPAQMERARQSLDSLTARFEKLSQATLPLTQEILLLDQCRANLSEWRNSIGSEDSQILRSLLTRALGVLIGLGIVLAFSELWRRGTARYVREARRRHQLLLVRRFATGFLMAMVIILGFITEFSSLATFAGFLTAGIAVALQTVILSIAAYFFIIGRYGVRVGDRITVSGVTGDVVDIGLARFHMMELAGTDLDLYPTGRLVTFSNSVLFQNAPLFRRIPGTAYVWHEAAVTFQRDGNYKATQSRLLEGVNSVYSEYRDTLEQQHSSIERLTETAVPAPAPGAQLRFLENGFELAVRYPIDLQDSSEIDARVVKRLTEIINAAPELKATAGPVQIRSANKV